MKILLDTHAWLWFVLGDPKLSGPARQQIEDPANEVLADGRRDYQGSGSGTSVGFCFWNAATSSSRFLTLGRISRTPT